MKKIKKMLVLVLAMGTITSSVVTPVYATELSKSSMVR